MNFIEMLFSFIFVYMIVSGSMGVFLWVFGNVDNSVLILFVVILF